MFKVLSNKLLNAPNGSKIFMLKPVFPTTFDAFALEFWIKFIASPVTNGFDLLADSGSTNNFKVRLFCTVSPSIDYKI